MSISFQKSLPSFSTTEVVVVVEKPFLVADDLLNDTPTSLTSPRAEMAVSWLCHFSAVIMSQYTLVIFTERAISCNTF